MRERECMFGVGDRVQTNRTVQGRGYTLSSGVTGMISALDPSYGVWVMFDEIKVLRDGYWVPLVMRLPDYAVDKIEAQDDGAVSDR